MRPILNLQNFRENKVEEQRKIVHFLLEAEREI